MSVNVRFYTGKEPEKVYHKAWIYENASRKGTCVICKTESHGNILVRHKEPKKIPDTHICHQCLVLISKGEMKLGGTEPPKKKRKQKRPGRPKKPGTKKGTIPEKFQCKYCDKKLAKANVAQHMRHTHPDKQYVQLIDNLIIEDTNDAVGRSEANDKDPEA